MDILVWPDDTWLCYRPC